MCCKHMYYVLRTCKLSYSVPFPSEMHAFQGSLNKSPHIIWGKTLLLLKMNNTFRCHWVLYEALLIKFRIVHTIIQCKQKVYSQKQIAKAITMLMQPPCMCLCCGGDRSNVILPEFSFGITEALGDKINWLVGLILVRLHGSCVRVKIPQLWFVWQRVLDKAQRWSTMNTATRSTLRGNIQACLGIRWGSIPDATMDS